jgi:hypothetical protein
LGLGIFLISTLGGWKCRWDWQLCLTSVLNIDFDEMTNFNVDASLCKFELYFGETANFNAEVSLCNSTTSTYVAAARQDLSQEAHQYACWEQR